MLNSAMSVGRLLLMLGFLVNVKRLIFKCYITFNVQCARLESRITAGVANG